VFRVRERGGGGKRGLRGMCGEHVEEGIVERNCGEDARDEI